MRRRIRAIVYASNAAWWAAWYAALTDFDDDPWRNLPPAARHSCTDACDPDMHPHTPRLRRHSCTPGCNPGNCPHEDL